MSLEFDPDAAVKCVTACDRFFQILNSNLDVRPTYGRDCSADEFRTASQIGSVYESFLSIDIQTLLGGYSSQVRAMSMLFAAAGNLIDVQDSAVADALKGAAGPVPELVSLGSLAGLSSYISEPRDSVTGYERVGPEDVSDSPFEQIKAGADALDPRQFVEAQRQLSATADKLRAASEELHREISLVLDSGWHGQFAEGARSAVGRFTMSGVELADRLNEVAAKAEAVTSGFGVTRNRINAEAERVGQFSFGTVEKIGPGYEPDLDYARAIVNTEYNPAVMDANLSGMDFPAAYRVVSGVALGGAQGIDFASAWNTEGHIEIAKPAALATTAGDGSSQVPGQHPASVQTDGGASPGSQGTAVSTAGMDPVTTSALANPTRGVDSVPAISGYGHQAASQGGAASLNAGTSITAAAPDAGVPTTVGGNATSRIGSSASERGAGRNNPTYSGAAVLGGGAAIGGAGTLAGLGNGSNSGGSVVGGGPSSGLKGTPGGIAAGSTPSTGPINGSTPSTTGSRATMAPMGGGIMGTAAGNQDKNRGHKPASYLVNAMNTSELIGRPQKVSPAIIGRPPTQNPGTT